MLAGVEEARGHGIRAAPFFGIGDAHGVTGAQPLEALHGALMRGWAEAPERAIATETIVLDRGVPGRSRRVSGFTAPRARRR